MQINYLTCCSTRETEIYSNAQRKPGHDEFIRDGLLVYNWQFSEEFLRAIFNISILSWADFRMPPLSNLLLQHTIFSLSFTSISVPITFKEKPVISVPHIHLFWSMRLSWREGRRGMQCISRTLLSPALAPNLGYCLQCTCLSASWSCSVSSSRKPDSGFSSLTLWCHLHNKTCPDQAI